MVGDRFTRARELFLAALEQAAEKRCSYLQEACSGDEELLREVASLLSHHEEDPGSARSVDESTALHPSGQAAPRTIGPYHLLQKLGEGGMGEVYEAEQEKPVRRRVAIKLVKWGMSSKEVLARFESERQALALMSHPNIARVFDAGATEQGRPYFAMEYVAGVPLTDYCDTNRLSVEERLDLFIRVCRGVQHAHHKGVIHRDIKPSNILVTIEDGRPVPKIIDFGVAKATSARLTERTLFTQLGQWIGTPEYMSPEQAEMTVLDVDTRTDVYSLGVVLYELLVGARPFESRELREVGFDEMRRTIREKDPVRPSTRVSGLGEVSQTAARNRRTELAALARELRGDLDWVTMRALEKDRTRRYGSPAELGADLERHLRHEPVLASPPSTPYRVRKFVRRHRLGVGAGVMVVAALLVAITGTSLGLLQAKREAARARQVSEFLVRMFEDLDPETGLGPTVSVRDILDRGAGRIDRDLADQPLERTRLMAAIGRVYTQIGDYEKARPLLEGSLAVRRQLLGDDHPDVAASAQLLGWLMYWSGDYPGARAAMERALEIREAAYGPEHPQVGFSLTSLGFVLWRSGEYGLARSHLERAVAIHEKTQGPDSPSISHPLYFVGLVFMDTGEYEKARSALQRCLAIRERSLGPDHPLVGWALHDLGRVYLETGDLEASRPLLERALEVQEKALGPDHLFLAFPVTKLAIVHSRQGDYAAARPLFERALAIREGALGPDHPDLAWTLRPYGAHLRRNGDLAGARRLSDRALAIVERAYGPEHVEVARCLEFRAYLEVQEGRYGEARASYERATAIRRKIFAPDLPARHRNLYNLACVESLAGNKEKALGLLRQAVDAGWANRVIFDDPDLDPLRGDPRFEALLGEVRTRPENSAAAGG